MRLSQWLETWFSLYVLPAKLAPSTVAMYRRAINAVPKWLGEMELAQVTALELQRWLVQVARQTPRAAQLDRVMLSRSLHVAGKLGLCSMVIDQDTLPKPQHVPAKALVFTQAEARRYVEAVAIRPSYVLLLLCLVCGLRRGEALGLRWSDIDVEASTITITHQRQRVGGSYQLRPLKSTAAHRSLLLPPELMRLLQAQPRTMTGYLVDTTPELMRKDHLFAIRSAHLPPVTIHGLRHTMATLSAGAGCPMKLLQSALGHSTYQLTADLYAAHLLPPSAAPGLVWQGLAVI